MNEIKEQNEQGSTVRSRAAKKLKQQAEAATTIDTPVLSADDAEEQWTTLVQPDDALSVVPYVGASDEILYAIGYTPTYDHPKMRNFLTSQGEQLAQDRYHFQVHLDQERKVRRISTTNKLHTGGQLLDLLTEAIRVVNQLPQNPNIIHRANVRISNEYSPYQINVFTYFPEHETLMLQRFTDRDHLVRILSELGLEDRIEGIVVTRVELKEDKFEEVYQFVGKLDTSE